MLRRVTCVSGLWGAGGPREALRVLISRANSTISSAQVDSQNLENAKPWEELPGPKPLPVIGNVWRFLPLVGNLRKFGLMELLLHLRDTYGDIYKLTGIPGKDDLVVVFDPDEIEKVFRNEGPWPVRESVECFVYYRTVTRKDLFQGVGGLVTVQGEEWQKFRTKVNPTMMQPKNTKMYTAPIDTVASEFIKRIRTIRDHKKEMPADFNNELYRWSLESIAYIALDTRLGCLDDNLKPDSEPQKMIDAMQVAFETMYKMEVPLWKLFSTPSWKAFVKASNFFAEVTQKYIQQAMERMKTMPPDSDKELTVLEKLLARDPDPRTAMVMALDMMGAGIDTTSYSTAIAMYYLARNHDKQKKLYEEVKRLLPGKEDPITAPVLNEMKYLKACIKESMRISPITGGNQRKLVKDLVLRNYRVPKGTSILMPSALLSNMDKYFPDANKYMPERWLKTEKQTEKKHHPFVSLPFGFGPRMCIGRRFAELEIETLLAKIIRNFFIDWKYGDIKFQTRLLTTPVSPLKFQLIDREE